MATITGIVLVTPHTTYLRAYEGGPLDKAVGNGVAIEVIANFFIVTASDFSHEISTFRGTILKF